MSFPSLREISSHVRECDGYFWSESWSEVESEYLESFDFRSHAQKQSQSRIGEDSDVSHNIHIFFEGRNDLSSLGHEHFNVINLIGVNAMGKRRDKRW